MMHSGIRCAAIFLAAIAVVGCGGAGGTADSVGGVVTTTSTVATVSTAPTVTTEVSVSTTEAQSSSGGGSTAGVCELVTADELAGIFGVSAVVTSVLPGPPDNCIVESDTGDPLTAWSLTTEQASTVFAAFTTDPSAIEVSGIGDKAAFVQNTGLLVLKGGNLVVISISGGANLSDEEAMEAAKQIGAFAADRL